MLFVVTNDAWVWRRGCRPISMRPHSVLRAVENGATGGCGLGNDGWSGWIDEYGTIRHVLEDSEGSIYFRGSEVVEVTYNPKHLSQSHLFMSGTEIGSCGCVQRSLACLSFCFEEQ